MKKLQTLFLALALSTTAAMAQTSLAGRVYHNSNIMAQEVAEMTKDVDVKISQMKKEVLEKFEKEKGRKPNAQEMAEIEKKLKEARKMADTMKEAIKTSVTITFEDEKRLVVDANTKVNDAALKMAGISWAKRKMIKLATAVMPAQKADYKVQGNTIIVIDEDERDTLYLSNDGKQLTGNMDGKPFVLTRTK